MLSKLGSTATATGRQNISQLCEQEIVRALFFRRPVKCKENENEVGKKERERRKEEGDSSSSLLVAAAAVMAEKQHEMNTGQFLAPANCVFSTCSKVSVSVPSSHCPAPGRGYETVPGSLGLGVSPQ